MALRPIGSVVRLQGDEASVMIVGHAQKDPNHHKDIYDYIGVKYPEGYDGKKAILFNEDMIGETYSAGLLDPESIQNGEIAAAKVELLRRQ